ncbi:MBOAT family protein [Clostridiales bacterium]|nr:MBOAT family protein [Clostridiales bacterium]
MGGYTLQRKTLFYIGILANIGLLGYYKYTDFFIDNINVLCGADIALKHIALPIGISFFTFQLIAFLVDCYKNATKEYDFINYLLFITFFPQLIVGPIVHHAEMVPQFENKDNANINFDNIAKGLFLFSIGCAKKILLADMLTPDAQAFFDNISGDVPFLDAWYYSIEYTISYYFDLSGYADMAIGLGLMFNIHIPQNFNSPYRARNFQDYWRRWHMTLSRFLGQYIFRNVYEKNCRYRNYYIATMVTFFVSGFWHGAGWTFVVWGLINGVFVCSASWMKQRNMKLPFVLAWVLTAIGVVVLRALFVAETFTDAICVYKGMANFQSLFAGESVFSLIEAFAIDHMRCGLILIIGIIISCFIPNNSKRMADEYTANKFNWIMAFLLLGLCLINMNKVGVFLYFQF